MVKFIFALPFLICVDRALAIEITPCGLSGTLDERIQNCQSVGSQKPGFILVSQDSSGHYLVLDQKTNLIWSQHLPVKQQYNYYGQVDISRIHNICSRFQPFGLVSKVGWRLPSILELKRTARRGNEMGSSSVLSSSTQTLSRLVYNGYSYDEEFKSVPLVFDERSKKKSYVDDTLQWSEFRCVVARSILKNEP